MMMEKILHREKIINVFLKYPILYFSLYFLYSTRSQFYIIKNIAIYDSIFHNLLVLWGLVIAFYGIFMRKRVYHYNKSFLIFWIISSALTIVFNIKQIRFDSIRSTILTIIVIITFLPAYDTLKNRYDDSEIFKYIFYPTIIFKLITSLISLALYFLNISIFIMGDLANPYTYGIRYVTIGDNTYNLLLYGTFFSPNKETMHAIPLIILAVFILLNKKILISRLEKKLMRFFIVVEFIVVSLCNSRGAMYTILIIYIIYICLWVFKNYKRNIISIKKVIIIVVSAFLVSTAYSGVKKLSAGVVSKVTYTRYVYDYNSGNIQRISEEEVRNNNKFEKYRGKIFEYNPTSNKNKERTEEKEKIVIEKTDSGEELGNGRLSIWKETLKLYIKKPLFGIGQGMNTEFAKKFDAKEFPILNGGAAIHNSYLAVLLYQGGIGLLVIIIWLFKLLLSFIKFELINKNNISFTIMHMNIYFILIVSLFLDVIFVRDEFTQLMLLFTIGYLISTKENKCE